MRQTFKYTLICRPFIYSHSFIHSIGFHNTIILLHLLGQRLSAHAHALAFGQFAPAGSLAFGKIGRLKVEECEDSCCCFKINKVVKTNEQDRVLIDVFGEHLLPISFDNKKHMGENTNKQTKNGSIE